MRHPPRAFKAEACALEGRLLMASTPPTAPVEFVGSTALGGVLPWPIQIVTQQAGTATVTLSRTDTAGPLQVEVTMNASIAPLEGANVGAVDQTVTFAPGQSLATATVPIIAGAPNPGEVDELLAINPVNATDPLAGNVLPIPLDLRIVASDPTLPPKVVSSFATNQGIVLSFNKPMDPVGASKVNNYSVFLVYPTSTGGVFGIDTKTKSLVKSLRFESAQYDPATQTVTLITKHPLPDFVGSTLTLSQVKRARRSVRTPHSSNVARGLTDLQGNPINADTTPGKVEYRLVNNPINVGGLDL
jgi:hypothetical protein